MTTNPENYTKGRSSSITEYAPNEINRTTREKGMKTLQDIRKDNLKANNLAADNVKDFLQDTNHSFSSEDGKLPNDAHRLEKRIIKQQYLVNNKLFDPTEYFGGLDISNLDEHTVDRRLEDMFQYYLPTEAEEKEVTAQPIVKQTQSDKTQTKTMNPPKQLDLSKSNWSTSKANTKTEGYKSITKEFPETTKAGKDPIEFEPLSPLSTSHAKMHSNFKKEFGQNLLNKTKNPVKAKTACQTVATVVQEYKPVVVVYKKKKSTGLSDKENKVEERDPNQLRAKKSSSSVSKKPGSAESKPNYRTISDVNSNSFVPKSANTSLSRNNRSTVQDGHHNYSLNTTAKINLSSYKSDKFTVSEKTSAKDDAGQRLGSTKMDTQSTGRSKTKSSDQVQASQNLRRNRKGRKNFSSFNSALTAEDEPEFLFKSFNTLARPQTSQTVAIDDNNYVLKGILSPTMTKTLVSKGINSSKGPKNTPKTTDKPQPVNPLKFLNDLLNKRKISAGSSEHLRMPKKPTFLENKVGSPVAQIGPRHAKTPSKSDLFEARITNQVNKKAQGVNASNYASANTFKNLFTLKGVEK